MDFHFTFAGSREWLWMKMRGIGEWKRERERWKEVRNHCSHCPCWPEWVSNFFTWKKRREEVWQVLAMNDVLLRLILYVRQRRKLILLIFLVSPLSLSLSKKIFFPLSFNLRESFEICKSFETDRRKMWVVKMKKKQEEFILLSLSLSYLLL